MEKRRTAQELVAEMSNKELAELLGFSVQSAWRVKRGTQPVTRANAAVLARHFGVRAELEVSGEFHFVGK